MPTNKKSKDNTTKSEPVKLQPRNINKPTKVVFENKRKTKKAVCDKTAFFAKPHK